MSEVLHLIFEVRKSSVTLPHSLMRSQTPKVGVMPRPKKTPHPFDAHLGGVIKGTRTRRKMTQKDLSEAAGIPLANFQRREDGTNDTSVSELERIAVALRVSPRELVDTALADYSGTDDPAAGLRMLVTSVSEPTPNVADHDNVTYLGTVTPGDRVAANTDEPAPPKD